MKKVLLFLFILTISFAAIGQETKRIKKNDGNSGEVEIFHVLKSDKNVKHGPYEKYLNYSSQLDKGRLLTEKGQYTNNKKTGIWTYYRVKDNTTAQGPYENDLRTGDWEYHKDGELVEKGNYANDKRDDLWIYIEKEKGIEERGYYKDGKKVGKWIYHYYNIPIQTYDHSLDSVLQFYDDLTDSEVIINASNDLTKVVLSRPPQYIGHKRQLQHDMSSLTKYPAEAKKKLIAGQVFVSFIVNEDGTTSDFTILQDFGWNCGQAMIDAYKTNTSKWIPGIYNGKKVKVRLYQTVNFGITIDPIIGIGQSQVVYE